MFGSTLKKLRVSKGWTQNQLAKELGIVRTAISNYETGRAMPDANTLTLLADLFHVSIDDLLKGNNPSNKFITSSLSSSETKKDITKKLDNVKNYLHESSSTNAIFDGEPLTDEARQSIISAIEVGLTLARQKNSEKI